MTPYQLHVREWSKCQKCVLHKTRQNVVLCRGSLPCDVLFVGEAPGDSEDVIGQPFKGPAGKLLDELIYRAFEPWVIDRREDNHPNLILGEKHRPTHSVKWAMTNLISCIPYEGEAGGSVALRKAAEPPPDAVDACRPRLVQLIEIAKPAVIVCVGKCAEDEFDPKRRNHVEVPRGVSIVSVAHPAAILRANEAQYGLACQRTIITIRNAWNNCTRRK